LTSIPEEEEEENLIKDLKRLNPESLILYPEPTGRVDADAPNHVPNREPTREHGC
jgi:hypothetical protein